MPVSVDCAVIGAGVVGLAIGREMARSGLETVILESEDRIGTGISARNSEVIHAGIYYPPGSLRAVLCVSGKERLYRYCSERKLPHQNCGKLVVATRPDQLPGLERLRDLARANGVPDLQWLTRKRTRALEPEIECAGALLSPSTGTVDVHALMLSLQGDFEAAGGMLALASPVVGGRCRRQGALLRVGGGDETELDARMVVNSAGLHAHDLALVLDGLDPSCVPAVRFAKGNYFSLGVRPPFSRLVYPLPGRDGLGIHLTLDLAGRARFGPDVEWVEELDYTVDSGRLERFCREIRKYWPGLPDGVLSPDYSGIRPKLGAPGSGDMDFMIQGAADHGVPGLVNLFGIDSPGLTATLAIAESVRRMLLGD